MLLVQNDVGSLQRKEQGRTRQYPLLVIGAPSFECAWPAAHDFGIMI